MNQKQPEPVFVITASSVKELVDYILAVPTGNLPGVRLARALNTLNELEQLPPAVIPLIRQAAMMNPLGQSGPVNRVEPPPADPLKEPTPPAAEPPQGSNGAPPKAPAKKPTESSVATTK